MKFLKLLRKGDGPRDTFLDTLFGNLAIKAINAVLKLRVIPEGLGKFDFAEGGSTLTLNMAELENRFARCELRMSGLRIPTGHGVTWSWGRIANRQPTGFNTNGMIEPLPVADDGQFHYFFAKCTVDPVTLNCTASEIVEAAFNVANTATIVYYLLGSAKVVNEALTMSPTVCGQVGLNLCDLLSYYPYV